MIPFERRKAMELWQSPSRVAAAGLDVFRTSLHPFGGKRAKQKRKKNVVLIMFLCAYACIAFQLLAVHRIDAPGPSGVEPWPEPIVYREEAFPRPDYEASHPGFAEAWPAMREGLCPNGVPDTELRFALFDLARREVGISPPSDGSGVGDWGPVKRFLLRSIFEGTYDGTMLSQYRYEPQQSESALSPSQNLGSIIYMIIWKNANIGISSQLSYYRTMGWLRNIAQVRSLPRGLKRAGYDPRDAASRPCIVTAIRDPVSHFLSGYTTVMHRIEHVFPMNFLPSLQRGVTTADKKEAFRLFFRRFLDLELSHGMGSWWASGILRHVFPYSRILPVLRENGVSLTGYVPTLTNLTSTWPKFLGEVCPNVPSGLKSTSGQHLDYPHNNPDGFQKGANDVWSEGTEYARALCAIHAFDYACWKLPDGVPRVCQEMFAKEEFIRAVTK